MPLVNVMVNGRAYTLACDEGEEEHLKELAGHVDEKVRELLGSVGQVGDQRLLLMAALLIADECHDAKSRFGTGVSEMEALKLANDDLNQRLDRSEAVATDALEVAAKRIDNIAATLARA